MTGNLVPHSPIPLYHQIAESIRYEIATGALAPGTPLPPLREAAARWKVNLHTVRQAYASLGEHGLVRTSARHGTVVLVAPPRPPLNAEQLADFLVRVVADANEQFGLSPRQFAEHLLAAEQRERVDQAPVYVVECSETQAADLANQLSDRWHVATEPWSLERAGFPPSGAVVATYFHYNDIRRRSPTRFHDVRFASTRPDPELLARLTSHATSDGVPIRAWLCERDSEMGRNIAADLATLLSPSLFSLDVRVEQSPGALLASAPAGVLLLFPPRMWAMLDATERADPRVFEVRYIFDDAEICAIAEAQGWVSRSR
ncbi:MAG: GntR family transcriptional regulator [bacterium]